MPFVAGGTTDTVARLIAQRMTDNWGQPAVVYNRPGGGSTIGTATVAKAAPDGHTLLVTTIAFAINASLMKTPYDPIKDFTPITELASIPLMLVVHPSLPVTNLKEFIAYTKAQPNGVDYASSGAGTSTHLAAEMFKSMTGAKLVHVPFKGNAEVLNALLGGHVKVHFALTASTLQHVRTGALRVIAVTTEKRIASLPDVPTIAELGYPGLRDFVLAGDVRAGRHAEGRHRQDQRRDHQDAGGRRRCASASARKAPTRSAARRSSSTSASAARSRNGPRWSRPPGWRRSSAHARRYAAHSSPISTTLSAANAVSTAIVASAPCRSISSAAADGASACTIRLGNASRPISVA